MRCTSCGYDRPATGACPHCGAVVPAASSGGAYSSLRGWKDQPGAGPSQSYARRNDPGASYPRRSDPNQSYPRRNDGYGAEDRALMASPNFSGALMSPDESRLPALPSEEEERALGIRRPAFIPATEARTGKRPTRWRVISGVMSMVILALAICGGSGFLLSKNVWPAASRFLGLTTPKPIQTPVAAVDKKYLNGPLVTPGPTNGSPVSGVTTALTIDTGPNHQSIIPQDPSAIFVTGENANLVVNISNQAKINDAVSVRWFINNVDITDSVRLIRKDCCDQKVTSDKGMIMLFSLFLASTGTGEAHIYYNSNNNISQVYTAQFVVTAPTVTATPQPTGPATTPASTTPSPTK